MKGKPDAGHANKGSAKVLTHEQIQSLLDENEDFLEACLAYQNMGRVFEALQ